MRSVKGRDWRTWRKDTLEDPGPEFWEACGQLTRSLAEEGIGEQFRYDRANLYEIRTLANYIQATLTRRDLATLARRAWEHPDYLLLAGVPWRARELYLGRSDFHGAALASVLLGEDGIAVEYFQLARELAADDVERSAIVFNMGQQFFWMGQLRAALDCFFECRRLCRSARNLQNYHLVTTWIAALQHLLSPPPDRPARALALRVPLRG